MIAAWYDRQGPAADVLRVGEMPTAEPGPGDVRVRLRLSGVNPGDIKKRQSWLGSSMAFPRIVPHSDGAGVIEAVGQGADPARIGRRVWVYGAQSYRPFGTAAQATVVPSALAVGLPAQVSDEMGACFGIPGITAHHIVALRSDPAATAAVIRDLAPDGVDRVVEVALSANADLDAAVVRNGAVVAAYASPQERPELPFWPMLFANVTIRLLGSDDFPQAAKDAAARDLTAAAAQGALSVAVARTFPMVQIAAAHELVESGSAAGRVLLSIP